MPIENVGRVTLVMIALVYGAMVYRTAANSDDGGPPMGALCMAAPAFLFLLVAATPWGRRPYFNAPPPRVRRAPGTFCTQCGRDLTGNLTAVCPDCGTPAAGSSPPAICDRMRGTAMTYRGQVRNGQIVLDPGANLRDGAVVEVTEMDQAAGTAAEGRRDSPGQNGFSGREAELLQQINTGPSADLWTRYHDLIHKRDAAVLTLAEQRELIELSDRIEQANASRLALAAELARLRGVALATILRDLGIPGGARA